MARYKSQQMPGSQGGQFSDLIQLLNAYSTRAKEGITGSQEALDNLIKSAQTEEQFIAAGISLNNLSSSSSSFADTSLNQQALSNNFQNKNFHLKSFIKKI